MGILNSAQKKQAQLPRRHGCFDLISAERGSQAAYTASWVLTLQAKVFELVNDNALEVQLETVCDADSAAPPPPTLLPCLKQLLSSFDAVKKTVDDVQPPCS